MHAMPRGGAMGVVTRIRKTYDTTHYVPSAQSPKKNAKKTESPCAFLNFAVVAPDKVLTSQLFS